MDRRRNIYKECNYPESLTSMMYKLMYVREGIATRLVNIFPDECWARDPDITETAGPDLTPAEEDIDAIIKRLNLWTELWTLDRISGIGSYGLGLIGVNDNRDLSMPVQGVLDNNTRDPNAKIVYTPTFMVSFDENLVGIKSLVVDKNSPRWGLPLTYIIKFSEASDLPDFAAANLPKKDTVVHWTRVIHASDGLLTSKYMGVPRLENVYNYILNIQKILGADGEGFWQCGFPGLSVESHPNIERPNIDEEKVRKALYDYFNRMQRSIISGGLTVRSLQVQLEDASPHFRTQMEAIAIAKGVPLRKLMGSEQGKLASEEDTTSWNSSVLRRNVRYTTHHLVLQTLHRFAAFGAIRPWEKDLTVSWPDPNTPTDNAKANIALKNTQAMGLFVSNGGFLVMHPVDFFIETFGWSRDKATEVWKRAGGDKVLKKLLDFAGGKTAQGKGTSQGANYGGGSNAK